MKLSFLTLLTFFGFTICLQSCEEGGKKASNDLDIENIDEEMYEDEDEVYEDLDEEDLDEEDLTDAFSYAEYTFDKNYTEGERKKDIFDMRDRENDELIKVEFADGHSGSIVYRDGFWYNYSIREKTEKLFATKDDALQNAYDQSKLLQDAGAAIATMVMKKSRPLKKDGTPDMRYKENQDLK